MRIKRYINLFKKSFELEMERGMAYRMNFLLYTVGNAFSDIIAPIFVFLIYNVSKGIPGWSFWEFLLFSGTLSFTYGFAHVFFMPMVWRTARMIERGEFDRVLVRPLRMFLYLSITNIDNDGIGEMLVGIVIVVVSMLKLHILLSIVNLLLYVLLVIGGIMSVYALCMFVVAICIISVRAENVLDLLWVMMDMGDYPLTIYNNVLQFLFTFIIPLGITAFYPAAVVLGKISDYNLVIGTMAVVAVFFTSSILALNKSLKRYTSAGG